MIAVSGVRRSCETERSSAVFISSLRRSAAVSTTSALELGAVERGGEHRLQRRHDPLADSLALGAPSADGSTSVPICSPSGAARSRSGNASRRSSALTAPISIAADAAPIAGGEPLRGRGQGGVDPRAAEQEARHLGREVGLAPALSASVARARARSATIPLVAATTRNAASATQSMPSVKVRCPTGGRWKKLKAAALASAVARPRPLPQ